MKNKKFIFDIDGTITPSRGKIDSEFLTFFKDFSNKNEVYLVTGSDREKTLEQVTKDIYFSAKRVYNQSGSDVYEKENNVKTVNWKLEKEMKTWLNDELKKSEFPLRTGLHIEERSGMANFSVVGRNATVGERKMYFEYDNKVKERLDISNRFENKFSEIQAVVGGETGIDIFPRGYDKSQIIKDFDSNQDELLFFGDRMDKQGNDFPLAEAIRNKKMGQCYEVKNYKETWKYLEKMI